MQSKNWYQNRKLASLQLVPEIFWQIGAIVHPSGHTSVSCLLLSSYFSIHCFQGLHTRSLDPVWKWAQNEIREAWVNTENYQRGFWSIWSWCLKTFILTSSRSTTFFHSLLEHFRFSVSIALVFGTVFGLLLIWIHSPISPLCNCSFAHS